MTPLYRYSIRHPKRVIASAMLVTLAVAPGTLHLRLRTDGHALVPTGAPEILLDREIRDAFNTEDPIVVLIRSSDPNGIFNFSTVSLVARLTAAFETLDGVRPIDLFSLATEHGHRVWPGTLKVRKFLEPMPKTRHELDRLRDDLQSIKLYDGTLVSRDATATSIMVGVPAGMDRTELYGKILDTIAATPGVREEIQVIGAPVAEALLGTHILEDLGVPAVLLGHGTRTNDADQHGRLPTSLYEFRVFIAHKIGLVPIALAIMALVFLVSFRNLAAVALPLGEVGACLAFVFGLMGWLGVPVYLTIAVLPVILTAIGIADEVHIFKRYTELLRARPDDPHKEVLDSAMEEMWVPVTKTSVTTAIGFLSFALSPIAPVRAFGVFTAVGIMFCMLWSLTAIPALLAWIPPKRIVRHRPPVTEEAAGKKAPAFAWLGARVIRLRYVVLGVAVIVAALAPLGVKRIVVQDSWIDGFAPDSAFYGATQFFNDQFLGTHILLVRVDTEHDVYEGELSLGEIGHHDIMLPGELVSDPSLLIGQRIHLTRPDAPTRPGKGGSTRRVWRPWRSWIESATRIGDHIKVVFLRKYGSPFIALRLSGNQTARFRIDRQPLTTPAVLRRIADLEAFIENQTEYAVGGVIGTADYLATTNFLSRARKESERRIPDNPDRITWVWSQYQRVRGEQRRQQLVSSDYSRSLITVFMKNANFVDTRHLMDAIRAYEESNLAPHGLKLQFGGDVAVSQTLIDAIVKTQTRSLLLSLAGIWVVTAVMGRSIRWGLLCVLPCALAVLANFAVMGMVHMPLGVATSMFAGMTLGIGVDYAIHFLERYRLASSRGLSVEEALTDSVVVTGPAILIDALAVALGFGVLTLSQVPANARLGGLVVLSILGCFAATMFLLPALVRIWPPRQLPGLVERGPSLFVAAGVDAPDHREGCTRVCSHNHEDSDRAG